MGRIRLPQVVAPVIASAMLAALITCGLALGLTTLGFSIDPGGHWGAYVSGGLNGGSPLDTISGVARALPVKAGCGSRWLMAQPQLARISGLARDNRLSEAAEVCQRAAQQMLSCVPTSSVYGQCFAINRQIAIQECRATCNEAMCRAAKISCTP